MIRADRALHGSFSFVGHEFRITDIDWTRRYVSHLWSYHLHYFDYAVDLAWAFRRTADQKYADRFAELTTSWISGTEGRGDGLEPYPLATRTVNWIYGLMLLGDALSEEQRSRILESVHSQLSYLEKRIEWHLMANHVQRDLQALALGGLVFSSAAGDRWRRKWLPRLWRELDEQVLDDGGHFERSPMYHVIAAVDFLETAALATAADQEVPATAKARMRRMVQAVDALSRPNGTLHLFNDAADHMAPSVTYLRSIATVTLGDVQAPPSELLSLPRTGYFGYAPVDGHQRLIIDCGEPGPSYQPGHSHCDLLSFELDFDGLPLIVDSGVSGYEDDPLREYVRSTRAHNTVTIDGREQHEVWDVFRVARRATIEGASQRLSGSRYEFRGAYRPYHSRTARHAREIVHENGVWTFTDTVIGALGRRIESYLHFHPEAIVHFSRDRAAVRRNDTLVEITFFGFDSMELICGASDPAQGWHCGEFGKAREAPCVTGSIRAHSEQPFGYRLQQRA